MKGNEMRPVVVRRWLSIVLTFFFVLLWAGVGFPQETDVTKYPARPITLILPMPPGGGTDVACRLLAKEMEKFGLANPDQKAKPTPVVLPEQRGSPLTCRAPPLFKRSVATQLARARLR